MNRLLHIFRAGQRPDSNGNVVNITSTNLAESARAYDSSKHEAPLTIGHPKDNAPAWGWVSSLCADGDDLNANPHQVDANFQEMVSSGRFKKISASFYLPDSPSNPVPGVYYLRHVGFLGAQPPAVKGLRDAQFTEDEQFITFEEALMPAIPPHSATTRNNEADFAEREARLAEREARLAEREAATALRQHADYAEQLVFNGQLLPRQKSRAIALLAAQPNDKTVSFAEGDETKQETPLDMLRGLLNEIPKQVEYKELSNPANDTATTGVTNFSAPTGYTVDANALALHAKALAYQQQHNVDYVTAVQAIGG